MKRTVLVVDDEVGGLTLMGIMLERGGFAPWKAKDARSAISLLENRVPDLIILDVMMPGMDGVELCRWIRKCPATATIPILILSARADDDSIMRGIEAGANDYLPKPVLHHHLNSKVRQMLNLGIDGDDRLISHPKDNPLASERMGELFQKTPQEVLVELRNEVEEHWAGIIAQLVDGRDNKKKGRAVVAAALWHHDRYTAAPFNSSPGQRAFWSHIRHALGSNTASGAIEHWALLAPVASAIMNSSDLLNDALPKCLFNDNPECRQWALRILMENNGSRAAGFAERALGDPDSDVRTMAVAALGKIGNFRHVPTLVPMLNDAQAGVREQAAEALATIGGEFAAFALGAAVRQGSSEAAEAAANGLAILANGEATMALLEAVEKRSEHSVLRQIAHALGKINSFQSRQGLLLLTASTDPALRQIAASYLER